MISIIPTLNEESYIGQLLSSLSNYDCRDAFEIIVADGGSIDRTVAIAAEYSDVKIVKCRKASRACQMNYGSHEASDDILYFVHADVGLVPSFMDDIEKAADDGYISGC